jgi:hypothetical protein
MFQSLLALIYVIFYGQEFPAERGFALSAVFPVAVDHR